MGSDDVAGSPPHGFGFRPISHRRHDVASHLEIESNVELN
jgi:hypothetical protein